LEKNGSDLPHARKKEDMERTKNLYLLKIST
jgi:hypothetical protein